MAHFAEIDTGNNNIVLRVIVVHNNELLDNGVESEAKGIEFCNKIVGKTNNSTRWIQTSYNASFRGKLANADDTYDEELDIFKDPQPFPSWTFNLELAEWQPPIPYPENSIGVYKDYTWNEETMSWDLITPEKPLQYPSFVWNSTKWTWEPPVAVPEDAKTLENPDGLVVYCWDEAILEWITDEEYLRKYP